MKKVEAQDLQPCDVLLCCGEGLISDMIILLDGGTYSHAAIYDGEGVVQATLHGIVKDDVQTLKEEVFVDVFRFDKKGHHLGDEGWPYQPIVKTADTFASEGLKYATDHLILLAFLAISRQIKLEPFEKKLLRIVLDHATEIIFKLLDKGTEPMVCSELVDRCFDEADGSGKYELTISGVSFKVLQQIMQVTLSAAPVKTMATVAPQEAAEFEKSKAKFYQAWMQMKGSQKRLLTAAGNFDPVVPACVTPKDLETSPDLLKVGRLFG